MKKRLLLFFLFVGLFLLNKSCIKTGDFDFDDDDLNLGITYDLAFPLVNQTLTFGELLPDFRGQYVIADSITGLLRIVYREEFEFHFRDLGVYIPDVFVVENLPTIPIPPDSLFPGNSISRSETVWQSMTAPDGFRIDSARTQNMNFSFFINTEIRNPFHIEMIAHNVVDTSGHPLTISESFEGVRAGNQNRTIELELSNYYIFPDHSQPEYPHALRFEYTITVFRDTLATQTHFASTTIQAHFRNIEIEHIHGYFGQQNLDVSGYMDLSVFDRFPMDLLEIETANMQISVTNSFGIPIWLDANISTLTHSQEKTQRFNQHLAQRPSLLATPITTTFSEEIQDLINVDDGNLPYRVIYSANLTLNPDNDPAQQNFLSGNSFVRVEAGVEVPLRLRVGGLVVSDTIAFGGVPFPDGLESFSIRANIHNAFPLDATVFLYLLDNQYQIMDSIWTVTPGEITRRPIEVLGGVVGDDGHVSEPTVVQLEIPLSSEQIESLSRASHIKIKGILNTSNHQNQMINIFENSDTEGFLRVMIGARIRFTI
ncbi:MAG: hypothetical protein FWC98_00610 [Bacteroidales bacterium]|nr:hypothetical protein [Bacteroidales bacterium]